MFLQQKLAFRALCSRHKLLYRMFNGFFHRRENRVLRAARRARGIDGNLVVFSSYKMEAFNDNPFYICMALRALRPETDVVWLFKDVAAARKRFDIPGWVRCVGWNTSEGMEALGRARVIVDNFQKYDWLRLGRGQAYLFSPHHDRTFKHGGYSRRDRLYGRLVERRASMATTGSDFGRTAMARYYHYRGPCIDIGLPRNDILARNDPADEARVRKKLGIPADTGVLLYAPTFRDADTRAGCAQPVPLDLSRALDAFEETTRRPWVCLVRAHYQSLGLDLSRGDPRLMGATAYPEMAELLRVADALITDYSCCAGDFALRGKPVFLYISDIDDYAAHSRALWIDPRDTPYRCARTQEALEALIRSDTPERSADNCRAVLAFYGAHETGRAAEAAAQYICNQLDGQPGLPCDMRD